MTQTNLTTELATVFPGIIIECPHDDGLFESEIATILNQRTGFIFKGVYAINELSTIPMETPAGYVVNSNPRWLPGSHWMAVYTDAQGVGKFFDVFGLPPQVQELHDILNRRSPWTYSNKLHTSISAKACGQYCICFLLEVAQLDLMQQIQLNELL